MAAPWSRHHCSGHGPQREQDRPPRDVERISKVMDARIPKMLAVAVLGASGLLAIIGPDIDFDLGRRLPSATARIQNIYVDSVESAVLMPPVPSRGTGYVPSHIKMCHEWLRQDAALDIDSSTPPPVDVVENEDVCLDWTAPHYAVMEIVSSSVLNAVLPDNIRYRHGCLKCREHDEQVRGYDWSPLQTIFQESAMEIDKDLLNVDQLKGLCKACLAQYDSDADADASRVRSRAFHHCFALPERSGGYVDPMALSPVSAPTPIALPPNPDLGKSTSPISSVVRPLKSRIFRSAVEFLDVTNHPPHEPNTGTVIVIDPNTLGIASSEYNAFIPPQTSSITILAGPLCYTSNLPTGQNCAQYGKDLAKNFTNTFPNLDGTGFRSGPFITFQISASTAGINSRAVFARILICPPHTPSCLLPAVGKTPPAEAKVLEVPCLDCPGADLGALPFLENVGADDSVQVIQLPDHVKPPVVQGTPSETQPTPIPDPPKDYLLSPAFADAQKPIVGDGYPDDGSPVPSPVDHLSLSNQTGSDNYKSIKPQLRPVVEAVSMSDTSEPSPLKHNADTETNRAGMRLSKRL